MIPLIGSIVLLVLGYAIVMFAVNAVIVLPESFLGVFLFASTALVLGWVWFQVFGVFFMDGAQKININP
jgi:hypothetical protein